MCGRYTSTAAFDELALRFGITVESGTNEGLTASYNVAPSQTVPIITASPRGRRLIMAKWGFHPAWVNEADTAEAHYRQALSLAEELRLRSLIAHCHLGLGVLYRRAGTRQQAREHLTIATTMYREMEMPFWLEKAKADAEELA